MLLLISLILIVAIIGLSLFIQYLVKSTDSYSSTNTSSLDYMAMIISDYKTGNKDNRINLLHSAVDNYSREVKKDQRLLFFIGDNFSYNFKDYDNIFNNEKGLLYYFNPENIFYTIANYDSINKELTKILVNKNIYLPTNINDIFWDIGYYKKHIPNSTIYIICFNSMLYSGYTGGIFNIKQQKQINQLIKDLDSLQPENTVYILTNDPVFSGKSTQNFILSKIDDKYKNKISGIFTSHKNNNNNNNDLNSTNYWDSSKGKAYEWNIPSIYDSSYISVKFPLNNPLIMATTDVVLKK